MPESGGAQLRRSPHVDGFRSWHRSVLQRGCRKSCKEERPPHQVSSYLDSRVNSRINRVKAKEWMTDAMNEDLSYIEPEWKSALMVFAVGLVGLILITAALSL